MGSLFRLSITKLIAPTCSKQILNVKKNVVTVRTITSKLYQDPDKPPKPAPYPYNDKSFTLLNYFFDKTTARLDENSKIIVVEGSVASGKSEVAKQLAEELGMLYMPEANLDMYYINDYGFDLRTLDEQLPESCRSFDVKDFLMCPMHRLAAAFQIKQYSIKFSQYIDALAHLLSTGQGVVLDRCVYSDFVFTEAMYKHGYLSKLAHAAYYDVRKNTINELLRPHLVIYLDVPVNKIRENINCRAITFEKNSPVLTPEYLTTLEKVYKQEYLKEISKHAELLVYDWSDKGDVEVVVEDIERIDFDNYDDQDPKMKDWPYLDEEEYGLLRHKYADRKDNIMTHLDIPVYHVPELMVDAEEIRTYYELVENAPGNVYMTGYNAAMGDEGILFRTRAKKRDTLPLRERQIC